MTHKTNRYGIYKVDHTKFGGIIYPSDFNIDCKRKDSPNGSSIAQRIEKDKRFDEHCRKNCRK